MKAHFIGHLIGFDFSASPYLRGILRDARQIRDRAFHYLLHFFAAVAEYAGVTAYKSFIVPAGTLAVVWALGELTEKRKATVRHWVTAIFEAAARAGARPASAPAKRSGPGS